jgi:hypothetical protein
MAMALALLVIVAASAAGRWFAISIPEGCDNRLGERLFVT